jgi:hypothetical protein
MAAKKKAAKGAAKAGTTATSVYASARENPYLQRIVEDAEMRANVRDAYESARRAYGRLSNGKAPTKVLLEDKKLHKELSSAAESLRDASVALRGKQKKRRGLRLGRLLFVGLVGGALALALSEGLRSKVLDLLFGAEEEFDYSSATVPPAPAAQPAASSA